MSELLVRIDDCLLHAQVLHTWTAAFAPQRLVLAQDRVAADPTLAAHYRALAEEVAIEVTTVAAAAAALRPGGDWPRTLLVVGSAADALRLVEEGAAVRHIQVGGLHAPAGKPIAADVVLDVDATRALQALLARGVELEARNLPSTGAVRIDAALLARLWP